MVEMNGQGERDRVTEPQQRVLATALRYWIKTTAAPRTADTFLGFLTDRLDGRSGSEFERSFERGNEIRIDGQLDRSGRAGNAADEAPLLEPDQHRVHRRRREIEELLKL